MSDVLEPGDDPDDDTAYGMENLRRWTRGKIAHPRRELLKRWAVDAVDYVDVLLEIEQGRVAQLKRITADLEVLRELIARREREQASQAASKARVVNTLKGVERRNQELARENRHLRAQLERRPDVEATARELLEALRRPVLRLDELLDIADRERAGHDA